MTDAELDEAIDNAAVLVKERWPMDWYLEELARRSAEKQTDTMLCLTKIIGGLTGVSTLFVVLSAFRVVG